jgi:hypothetical protein
MKTVSLIIIFGITSSLAFPTSNQVCSWESNLKSLVQKLTPNGQKLVNQKFLSILGLFYSSIQPVYAAAGKKYDAINQQLIASRDASTVLQVAYILGVGNSTAGLGLTTLPSLCQNSIQIDSLISSMLPENQQRVLQILNYDEAEIKALMPSILNKHKANNYNLYQQLYRTENPATLNAISSAFRSIYG